MTYRGFYFRRMDGKQVNALRARLNKLALTFGYEAERGGTAKQGNLAAMLVGLDKGDLFVGRLEPGQYAPAIQHLSSVGEDWADAIVIALRAALQRQAEAEETE